MERMPALAFQIRHEASPARSEISIGVLFSDHSFGGVPAKRDKREEGEALAKAAGGWPAATKMGEMGWLPCLSQSER